jgi:DNA-binding GntR family transcriptional regulator
VLKALDTAPALADQVYEALLAAIVSGELAPGERHTQESLAARLGVSRQPVLQALVLLRRQGLVMDGHGRRGIEVAPLTADFVRHLYVVRGALDGLAARTAASRPRPELREPGLALIAAGLAAADDGGVAGLVEADLAFHRFLYEASGNPVLAETAEVHWHHTRRTMAAYLHQQVSLHSVWDEHHEILEAIVAGDAAGAEHRAVGHTERSAEAILSQLFRDEPSRRQDETPRRLIA